MIKRFMLRGNSCSGKTTAEKMLQQKRGWHTMLVSQDVVRRDMLHVKDGKKTEELSLLKELPVYGKKHCRIVILEERHKTKQNCKEFGEEAMRRRRIEKDYLGVIQERTIGKEAQLEDIVNQIYEAAGAEHGF